MKLVRLLLAVPLVALSGCPNTGLICNSPDTQCGEGCNNLNADPTHCGSCGIACGTGFVCQNSQCICDPGPGFVTCGQSCVDIRVDHANCGACGNACPTNQLCEAGDGGTGCVTDCMPGNTACSGSCTDTTSDSQNCGTCGTTCVQGTSCVSGVCQPGLVAACYNSGQLYEVDPVAEVVGAVPATASLSPIAVAFNGSSSVYAADELANVLYGFSFASNGSFASTTASFSLKSASAGPQGVTIKGGFAYVVNSTDHSLDVFDLSLMPAMALVCPSGNPGCTASYLLQDNSYPQYVAISDDAGEAFVTMQGNTELADDAGNVIDDPNGNRVVEINLSDLSDGGLLVVPHRLDAGYQPRPQGIAVVNGKIFVALANLSGYLPGAPGEVDVFALFDGGSGSFGLLQQDIELGGNCFNAGAMYPLNDTVYVVCGPEYDPSFTSVIKPGALGGVNVNTLFEAFPAQPFACPADAGSCSAGGGASLTYAAGKLFIGDSVDGRLFTADPTTGTILRGPGNALQVCPVGDGGGYNYISGVAAP